MVKIAEYNTPRVFISYVREDSARVDRLQRALESAGIAVWRDTAALWPGEDWRAKIHEAITGSALVFLACFSRNSLARKKSYQNEELVLAIEEMRLRRPGEPWLIPVRFDDCSVPDIDIGGGRTLAWIQGVDLFGGDLDYKVAIDRLIAAILKRFRLVPGAEGSEWADPPPVPEPYASRPTVKELLDFFNREIAGSGSSVSGNGASKPVIAQLTGEPGIGKTYIALHAAEQLRDVFTGGVLYAAHPRRPPNLGSFHPGGQVLLIVDDAEGLSAETLLSFAVEGFALLVVARNAIQGLDGPVFEAARLTPDRTRDFVSDLLAGHDALNSEASNIAELAKGSPLMAYLLVEEAKRRPDDRNWLETDSVTLRRFLELSYERLDDPGKTLLRRLALLRPEEVIDVDVAAPLMDVDVAVAGRALDAVQGLFGGSRNHIDRAVRDFAARRLNDEEPDNIAALHARIRRWRADRYGVLPRTRLTRDYWTTRDLLGYQSYADAISAFIRHQDTLPPLTIGVKGPWGAGKTSLMRMVQRELDPEDEQGRRRPIQLTEKSRRTLRRRWGRWPKPNDRLTMAELLSETGDTSGSTELRAQLAGGGQLSAEWRPTVWFNPWMYQSSEQVWAGLAGEIIGQVAGRLAPGDRERFWLRLNLTRLDGEAVRQSIYKLMLGRLFPSLLSLVLLAVIAVPLLAEGLISPAVALGGGSIYLVAASSVQIIRFFRTSASSAFNRMLDRPATRSILSELGVAVAGSLQDPGYAAKAGFLYLVQEDMRHVLDLVATPQQPLLVFVDDLDRCSPGTVSEVIEAINLFLAGEFPNCLFVIAMEPDLLAAHVEVAYKELVAVLKEGNDKADWSTLGWRFLDKIVQLPLSLPPIEEKTYLDNYMRDLLDLRAFPANADIVNERRRDLSGHSLRSGSEATERASGSAAVGGTSSSAQDVGTDDLSPIDMELVDILERAIRLKDPSIDDLPDAGTEVQEEVTGSPRPIIQETITAIDRVFADLYSDDAAWTAIKSALPQFGSSNPRELKRYLNLFRFYSFITQRRRLEGITAPSGQQIAKVAALVIRWPQLLTVLGGSREGVKMLERLQSASHDAEEWRRELEYAGFIAGDYSELREFLASGETVADVAALLI